MFFVIQLNTLLIPLGGNEGIKKTEGLNVLDMDKLRILIVWVHKSTSQEKRHAVCNKLVKSHKFKDIFLCIISGHEVILKTCSYVTSHLISHCKFRHFPHY